MLKSKNEHSDEKNTVYINVPIDNGQLSPKVCTQILTDIIKYVVYQKQQIPYPFLHLKNIATNWSGQRDTSKSKSIIHERKVKQAVLAYQSLEEMFQSLESELKRSSSDGTREVVVLMGATLMSPQDVFRIQLPSLCMTMCDSSASYHQSSLLLIRCLTSSTLLNEIFNKSMVPTNTYVLLNKKDGETPSEWFLPKDRYSVPTRGNQVYISLQQSASTIGPSPTLNNVSARERIDIADQNSQNVLPKIPNCDQIESKTNTITYCSLTTPFRISKLHIYQDSIRKPNSSLPFIDKSISCYADCIVQGDSVLDVASSLCREVSQSRWYQARAFLKGFK